MIIYFKKSFLTFLKFHFIVLIAILFRMYTFGDNFNLGCNGKCLMTGSGRGEEVSLVCIIRRFPWCKQSYHSQFQCDVIKHGTGNKCWQQALTNQYQPNPKHQGFYLFYVSSLFILLVFKLYILPYLALILLLLHCFCSHLLYMSLPISFFQSTWINFKYVSHKLVIVICVCIYFGMTGFRTWLFVCFLIQFDISERKYTA